MSDFSERVKSLIQANNLTRKGMCRDIGINDGMVRQWEHGATPSAENAYKIAKYFNVSIEWLVSGENEKEYQIDKRVMLSDEERDLIDNYRKLDKRDKEAVSLLAKSLRNKGYEA